VRVKPSLWERIWYGAQAEKILALRQAQTTPVRAPLDEVKAGVLAEMQNISRTSGGVSGSPFANVMLPQNARTGAPRAAQRAALRAAPVRRRPRFGVLVAILAVLVVGYPFLATRWGGLQGGLEPHTLPQVAQAVKAAQAPATTPTVIEILDAVEGPAPAQGTALNAGALGKYLTAKSQPAAMPVANQRHVLWLSTGMTNTGKNPLRAVNMHLRITDQAGVVLLNRTLEIAGPVAAGAALPPQRLALNPQSLERFVGQVPLSALKVYLSPQAALAL
jgi:hypothetical protein